MPDKKLFDQISFETSKNTTRKYSTSFSLAIRFLNKRFHEPIYNIYGFVRLADEIVDSFHDYDKATLLSQFKTETFQAIRMKLSLNPILNSFQKTVHQYGIAEELIETFLQSMEMDLYRQTYNQQSYETYILGSAEVVGLMCLKVFCNGDQTLYNSLTPYAMKLGAAFQKINFLRDMKQDALELNRMYFPGLNLSEFDTHAKKQIEKDISEDFKKGLEGIQQLPKDARMGVYLAYVYYKSLYKKIQATCAERILHERIRIPDSRKMMLLMQSYVRHNLNLL